MIHARGPNDKHLDDDSTNTMKRDLQKCLPASGFFYFTTFIPHVRKTIKKKQLNVKLQNLIKDIK